jgi:DNA-directed RNA polymerase subunit alpha
LGIKVGDVDKCISFGGVKEDVLQIMLNLKQLVVRVFADDPVTLTLKKKGPGPVTAADIEKNSSVEVVNPELVIANLTGKKDIDMEIVVGKGRGFKPVEEKDKKNYDLGTIVVDSVYTPVRDVGYKVEYTRVGDITNYERLSISIETNGTITPQEAMRQSTEILMNHFSIILEAGNSVSAQDGRKEVSEEPVIASTEEVSESVEESEASDKKSKKTKKK